MGEQRGALEKLLLCRSDKALRKELWRFFDDWTETEDLAGAVAARVT
jgi:hypothetical protein